MEALAGLGTEGKDFLPIHDFPPGEVARAGGSGCGFGVGLRCGRGCRFAWFRGGRGLAFLAHNGCRLRLGACGWRSCGGRGGRSRVYRCRSA